jgi:hypothetical protein
MEKLLKMRKSRKEGLGGKNIEELKNRYRRQ